MTSSIETSGRVGISFGVMMSCWIEVRHIVVQPLDTMGRVLVLVILPMSGRQWWQWGEAYSLQIGRHFLAPPPHHYY